MIRFRKRCLPGPTSPQSVAPATNFTPPPLSSFPSATAAHAAAALFRLIVLASHVWPHTPRHVHTDTRPLFISPCGIAAPGPTAPLHTRGRTSTTREHWPPSYHDYAYSWWLVIARHELYLDMLGASFYWQCFPDGAAAQQRSHQPAGAQMQGRFLEQLKFTILGVRNKLSTQHWDTIPTFLLSAASAVGARGGRGAQLQKQVSDCPHNAWANVDDIVDTTNRQKEEVWRRVMGDSGYTE